LIGLAHLSEISKDFDPDQIAKAALRMSAETGGGELARITAFQVCGRMKVAAAEPVLFQVAIGGETIPLRISAIGALGQVGDSQAKSLLMNILNGTEERLKRPAQQALLQIQSREEHSESAPRKAI
jgi:HEAT repeat protein